MTSHARAPLLLLLPLALVACGKQQASETDLDKLDNALTGANQSDPALASALRDQIMVDPDLSGSANAKSVRPPSRPDAGAVPPDDIGDKDDGVDPKSLQSTPEARDCPDCRKAAGALTLGELAKRQRNQSMADCAQQLTYSATWAARLPADVALYPNARVMEAAGADCGLRVVSYVTRAPVMKVLDWYYTRTHALGYDVDHQRDGVQHVLGGTRGDAAYIVYASPHDGGGTDIDLVANNGR